MRTTVVDERLAGLPEGVEFVPKGRMPPAPIRIRLRTSTVLRRPIPNALAVARAERKAARLWREHEPTRRSALETMRAIVTGTHREPEAEALAERQVVEAEAWDALFWQPWRTPSIMEGSRERLLDARSRERGLILSGSHLGPFFLNSPALVGAGVVPYVVVGNWFYEEPTRDLWGRRTARWRIGLPEIPVVRPRGSYATLAELLRMGLATSIYFDLPGPHETRFLGKPAMLVDGTARLAFETGAMVIPQRARRDGARVKVEYLEALDPRDFSGPGELHDALALVHERLILDEPAALQDPVLTGWKDCARPERWSRPARAPREGGGEL
jgi:lauroyl/myristoyl acyltransferase